MFQEAFEKGNLNIIRKFKIFLNFSNPVKETKELGFPHWTYEVQNFIVKTSIGLYFVTKGNYEI